LCKIEIEIQRNENESATQQNEDANALQSLDASKQANEDANPNSLIPKPEGDVGIFFPKFHRLPYFFNFFCIFSIFLDFSLLFYLFILPKKF